MRIHGEAKGRGKDRSRCLSASLRIVLFVLVAGGALMPLTGASAQTFRGGQIEITPLPLPQMQSGETTFHGYVEYRFRVINHDAESAHLVTLAFPEDFHQQRGNSLYRLERSVHLEPNTSAIVSIFQPPLPIVGSNVLEVKIDRRLQLSSPSFHMLSDHGYHSAGHFYGPFTIGTSSSSPLKPQLLVGRRVPPSLREVLRTGETSETSEEEEPETNSAAAGGSFHFGGPEPDEFPQGSGIWRAESTPTQWPKHWLAYSRFDAIVMTDDEFESMTPVVRGAVDDYLHAGGYLTILGDPKLPEAWTQYPPTTLNRGKRYPRGLGCATVTPDLRADFTALRSDWEKTVDLFANAMNGILFDREEVHDQLPLIDSLGIPLRLVLILILVFAILIGPVNVLLLKRFKRRIWLLWTVPALAVFFSTIVFYSTFLVEGFKTRSRSRTFTVLDQQSGKAVSLGLVGYYAPLSPRGGLHFDMNTCLLPVLSNHRNGNRMAVDWTADQNLVDGWISSRVPSHFFFRKCDSRKERITVDFQADPPTAVNGLGIDLKELIVAAGDGTIYHAADIAAGKKITLQGTDHKANFNAKTGRHSLRKDCFLRGVYSWGEKRYTSGFHQNLLWPGTYFAEAESWSPLLEPGLEKGSREESLTQILGILELEDPTPE